MEAGPPELRPVLLLHGIGANSLHWRFQLAALADRYRLIAWNAPGYLLSDNLRAETPSGRDYADALANFLTALGMLITNTILMTPWEVPAGTPGTFKWISALPVQSGFTV